MAIEKIKWRINKVLPLVYDDTLSYYETLCKVIAKCNEVIDDINSLVEEATQYFEIVSSLSAAVEQLQTDVDGLDDRVVTAEENISTINSEIEGLNNSINALESGLSGLSDTVSELPTEATVLYEHYITGDNDDNIVFYSKNETVPTALGQLVIRIASSIDFKVYDVHFHPVLSYEVLSSDPGGIRCYYVKMNNGTPEIVYKDVVFTNGIDDEVTQI